MQMTLALVVFVLALDDFIGTKILRAPLVACTLIGAVLGDVTTGMTIGATSQLFYTMLKSDYISSSLFSAVVTIVAIAGQDADAVNSIGVYFIAFAYALEGALRLLNTLFVSSARKQAEKGHISALSVVLPLLIRGVVFAVVTYFVYGNATVITDTVTSLYTNFDFLAKGLIISSKLLVCLGLAIVLRNLSVKDHYGALLAGFAVSAFAFQSNPIVLFFCGFLAFGIGAYSMKSNTVTVKEEQSKTKKGSAEKWW